VVKITKSRFFKGSVTLKYLRQLMIILTAFFLGELLKLALPIPIPGNVLGMLLLFSALYTGIVKIEMIEEVGEFLLSHLAFFFIPAGVGLITSYSLLRENWLSLLLICIISTAVVLLTTAFTVKVLKRSEH
jgi:holin-like protein